MRPSLGGRSSHRCILGAGNAVGQYGCYCGRGLVRPARLRGRQDFTQIAVKSALVLSREEIKASIRMSIKDYAFL